MTTCQENENWYECFHVWILPDFQKELTLRFVKVFNKEEERDTFQHVLHSLQEPTTRPGDLSFPPLIPHVGNKYPYFHPQIFFGLP